MEYFTITCRKHGPKTRVIRESYYDPMIAHLGDYLIYHTFEDDKDKPHVHLHGILKLSKGFLRTKLRKDGYNIKMDPIYDISGWLNYCRKDSKLRENIRKELDIQDIESPTQPAPQKNLFLNI